jgi:drug/metabolite transporter (DMT)-like permease
MNKNTAGFLYAALGAMAYGLNPLFAVPLYRAGMNMPSVLLFRYAFGALMLLALMSYRKKLPVISSVRALLFNAINGILMSFSSLFLYHSFTLIDVGLASTLLFVYPVMVAVIMALFFRERAGGATILAIALSILGVCILNGAGSNTGAVQAKGVFFVMLSSLAYALYIVFIRVTPLRQVPSDTQTFWSLIFGMPTFLICLQFDSALTLPQHWSAWAMTLGMAFFPTVISLTFTALAIKAVGATATAILGALEPLTAVAVGIIAFQEKLTIHLCIGMLLIIAAVTIVILRPTAPQK